MTLKQCMNMNLKSDNQKLLLEGNNGLKKLEKEFQNKQEIVENVKTEMALLQSRINRLAMTPWCHQFEILSNTA